MDEFKHLVWVCISLMLSVSILIFAMSMNNTGKAMTNAMNREQERTELIKEFREYNAYNNKDVYCQDVVSYVLEHTGAPYAKVIRGANTYVWQSNSAISDPAVQKATDYTSVRILEVLDMNKVYRANIVYGANGEVIGVVFTEK